MTKTLRDITLDALTAHAQGHIDKHVANVEILLTNPAGVAEHSNMLETIEAELKIIAEYDDQLSVLSTYFDVDVYDDDPDPGESRPEPSETARRERSSLPKNFKLRHSA